MNRWLKIPFIVVCGWFSQSGLADSVKTVYMSDNSVAQIAVSPKGMVLSFPTKPSKVILGNGSAFGVEYVENDIALTPVSVRSRANLFVYMLGRRFSFDLVASPSAGHAVVMVRDQIETPPTPKPEKVLQTSGGKNGRAKS